MNRRRGRTRRVAASLPFGWRPLQILIGVQRRETKDLGAEIARADIVVAAIGKAGATNAAILAASILARGGPGTGCDRR